MNASFILTPAGISRDDERAFGKALQFMGYDTAILCSHTLQSNAHIPQSSIIHGELIDNDNQRRRNAEAICILDCSSMAEKEIMGIVKRERPDIITNISPMKENKKIMQYPQSAFSEAFFQLLFDNSVMLGLSHNILYDANELGFHMFCSEVARNRGVPIIFDSFANAPDGIRARDDFRGLLSVLGLQPQFFSESKKHMESVIKKRFSNSFLISIERKL
jgi:hypothetical protein